MVHIDIKKSTKEKLNVIRGQLQQNKPNKLVSYDETVLELIDSRGGNIKNAKRKNK